MIRRLPRRWGIVVRCDGRDGTCEERLQTGNVLARVNRQYAKSLGWGRGSVRGTSDVASTKRRDLCPECMAADWARAALLESERVARREARAAARVLRESGKVWSAREARSCRS